LTLQAVAVDKGLFAKEKERELVCKGSEQGGTIKSNLAAVTLNIYICICVCVYIYIYE